MIVQVRRSVFETNSSSTHSLSIVTQDEFDYWKNNKDVYFVGNAYGYFDEARFGKAFVTKDEILAMAAKVNEEQNLTSEDRYPTDDSFFEQDEEDWYSESPAKEEGILSFEDWFEQEYLETYTQKFTTPSGDKMIAFGEYGTNY